MTGLDTMRVVISAEKDGNKHTDRLDLYLAKSRRTFANQCANRFGLQAAKVDDDLLAIIDVVEKIRQENLAKKENEKDNPQPMTTSERNEALNLLKDPFFLNRIAKDLDICGYVGEERAKKLCYLSAFSRITARPLSVIIRSSSAAGKSELMEKVAELMPPEEMEYFSRITPQALYYMEKDQLRNKLVIIDERSGSEEADYPLRTLQSKNKLSLAVVIKDPASGKSRTETLELNGPCAIWESTTDAEINSENASRCFEVWLDESCEQTQKIHLAQRNEFSPAGWGKNLQKDKIIAAHRNAQRLLENLKVHIPFQENLSFPAGWMRTRRDNKRFLSLIALVALLHQYQRKQKKTNTGELYIEATPADYKEAYQLAKGILKTNLSPLQKNGQEVLNNLWEMVKEKAKEDDVTLKKYLFSRRQVREWTGYSEPRVRRGLTELAALEYVMPIGGGQGRAFRYRLCVATHEIDDCLAGLTTPEELFALTSSTSSDLVKNN